MSIIPSITPIAPMGVSADIGISSLKSAANVTKSFGEFVTEAAKETVDTIRAGETAMINGVTGKGSLQQAVIDITASELTLQTAVNIRNGMTSAYMDLLRMPV